jgi:hypothetical protein
MIGVKNSQFDPSVGASGVEHAKNFMTRKFGTFTMAADRNISFRNNPAPLANSIIHHSPFSWIHIPGLIQAPGPR